MLIFDQLNKSDRHLRALSWCLAAGMCVLLAGVWWVQVVRSRHYLEDQRSQSYRSVRVPAPRGKILDRNGVVLAENRPSYNVSLYLEDPAWRERVQQQYRELEAQARQATLVPRKPSAAEKCLSWFGYEPKLTQSRRLTLAERSKLGRAARYTVTSNIVWELSTALEQPLVVNETFFHKHYSNSLALPLTVMTNLGPTQIARLQEKAVNLPGIEMDIQPLRIYPHGTLAAHVLGYLVQFKESTEDELAFYNYRLPDYRGLDGIESSFDTELRGRAGAKSVLVNNLGYRQSETVLSPIEAGQNVTLTIDANIQRVAEKALSEASVSERPIRGAIVVMDVRTGEIIAMASSPTHDPNKWIPRMPWEYYQSNQYTNEDIAPLRNRAINGNYHPGSTFKTVVALAGLDSGVINPEEIYRSAGEYRLGTRRIADLAGSGNFNFKRAFKKSSNSYFIEYGLKLGREPIVNMAEHLRFGERSGISLPYETPGILPTSDYVRKNLGGWHEGETANISIGQGKVDVTPLQMTVATAAVANGGAVLRPQIVMSVRARDALVDAVNHSSVRGVVRDRLPVSRRTLEVIQNAMLADTEEAEGTGTAARVEGYRICGKTGTAQVYDRHNKFDRWTVWFASYAPYEDPRYAVVVMVDYGLSGGGSCAPAARKIYEQLKYRDQKSPATRRNSVVKN
jgi:penicillin-binding protein 2